MHKAELLLRNHKAELLYNEEIAHKAELLRNQDIALFIQNIPRGDSCVY